MEQIEKAKAILEMKISSEERGEVLGQLKQHRGSLPQLARDLRNESSKMQALLDEEPFLAPPTVFMETICCMASQCPEVNSYDIFLTYEGMSFEDMVGSFEWLAEEVGEYLFAKG